MLVMTPPVSQHIGIKKMNIFQHLILGWRERETSVLHPLPIGCARVCEPGQTDGCANRIGLQVMVLNCPPKAEAHSRAAVSMQTGNKTNQLTTTAHTLISNLC